VLGKKRKVEGQVRLRTLTFFDGCVLKAKTCLNLAEEGINSKRKW